MNNLFKVVLFAVFVVFTTSCGGDKDNSRETITKEKPIIIVVSENTCLFRNWTEHHVVVLLNEASGNFANTLMEDPEHKIYTCEKNITEVALIASLAFSTALDKVFKDTPLQVNHVELFKYVFNVSTCEFVSHEKINMKSIQKCEFNSNLE